MTPSWLGFAYQAVIRMPDGSNVNVERNDGTYPTPHWGGKFVIIVDDGDANNLAIAKDGSSTAERGGSMAELEDRRSLIPRDPVCVEPGGGAYAARYAGFGVRFKIEGDATSGAFAVIEIELGPRRLVPPHSHVSEDELSYVLEGEVGFRVGDTTIDARVGAYVYKPRGVMHTFWNATDRPARILEVIAPAGLEDSFRDPPRAPRRERQANAHSDEWVPDVKRRYDVKLIGE